MTKFKNSEENHDTIFHKGFWVTLGLVFGLISIVFGMVQTSQAVQNEEINDVVKDVVQLKTDTATIKQQNIDIENRLVRIEDKLDTLLERR